MGASMGGVGDVFGSFDPNSGDPNGGLSGGQLFARKAVAGGLTGAGQALQSEAGGGTGGPKPVDFSKLGAQKPGVKPPPTNLGGPTYAGAPSRQDLQPPPQDFPSSSTVGAGKTAPSFGVGGTPSREELSPPPQDFPAGKPKRPYQDDEDQY